MQNNETAGHKQSRGIEMAAFDSLPPSLRKEIAEADRNWAASWAHGMHWKTAISVIRADQEHTRKVWQYLMEKGERNWGNPSGLR